MDMQNFCRKATTEELSFYDLQLYPLQDRVFEIASVYEDRIYLTGGTALSRFHYQHRLSEDLDFFTTTDDLRLIATDLAARLRQSQFNIEIERIEPYFARLFILENSYRLKIEFVKEYNLYGNLIETARGIYINNLEDMGANKISAFEDRAEIKDVIDLYYIVQAIPLERLFEIAENKRIPVAYERLLTINAHGISGLALMRQEIEAEEFSNFLDVLKQRTEAEVQKKTALALKQIPQLIHKLLWDFPKAERNLSQYSIPVLKRRLKSLALPEQQALSNILVTSKPTD